jgi:hypothetical protein
MRINFKKISVVKISTIPFIKAFIWPIFSAGPAGKLCQELATVRGSQHFGAFAAVSTSFCLTSRGVNTVID